MSTSLFVGTPMLIPPSPLETKPTAANALEKKPLLGLFLKPIVAGLLLRLIVSLVWLGGTEPYNDAADYFDEAMHLTQGTRLPIAFYWPPGTSYYLAGWFSLFGINMTVARLAMVALSTAQIPIVGLLALYGVSSRRAAVFASWIWALYPPSVFLVFEPYSQHLAGISLALIALCGISWLRTNSSFWLVLTGLCIGVGCLTRPSMMSVALVSGLCLILVSTIQPGTWLRRMTNAGTRCLLMVLPVLLVVGPSVFYNARCGAGYTLSTNNERNFFLGNNPHTPWYKTGLFAQRTLDELPEEVQTYLKSYYSAPNRRTAMQQAAMQHILQHPELAALRSMNRARAFWGFDYLASRVILATTGSRISSTLVLLCEAASYCAVVMLALIGLVFWKGYFSGQSLIWYAAVIAAYAGPYCVAFSGGTYHFPVMGIVIPFAAVGILVLLQTNLQQLKASRSLWTALLLFVAIQLEYVYFTLAAGISKSAEFQPPATALNQSTKSHQD